MQAFLRSFRIAICQKDLISFESWRKQLISTNSESINSFSVVGQWIIPEFSYKDKFWGELQYDPFKGVSRITLYGFPIFERNRTLEYENALGNLITGEYVSLFSVSRTDCKSFQKITSNSFVVFDVKTIVIGDKLFESLNEIRLKKYVFKCTNVKEWFDFQIMRYKNCASRDTTLDGFNYPPVLMLYEDDLVKIQLSTGITQTSQITKYYAYSYNAIEICAKGDNTINYEGKTDSILYYEKVIHHFFHLAIGKNCVATESQGIIADIDNASRDQLFDVSKENSLKCLYSNFFCHRAIDESRTKELLPFQLLLCYNVVHDDLQQIITAFFSSYHKFYFVFRSWIRTRNTNDFTEYSLAELIYSLEGLYRVIFPNCEEKSVLENTINNINQISPLDNPNRLINKGKLYIRQLLQDVILIKTKDVYPYLTPIQKNKIIDYLYRIRTNTAHGDALDDIDIHSLFPMIVFVEEIIAILIFQQIGLEPTRIYNHWRGIQEWNELKEMLIKFCN